MTKNFFNPAYDEVTIFTPEGEEHVCSRLNARELVAGQGFRWDNKLIEAAAPSADPVVAEEPATIVPEEVVEAAAAAPSIDLINAPLTEIALEISGDADVAKYLEGFTPDALRTMAEERYGEKISAKVKDKSKIIDRITAMEEVKNASEVDE